MRSGRIKAMVVDDSAVVRQVVGGLLQADPAIELLGTYSDPLFAMRAMEQHWPDVIVLDVEMPRMDGITFLRQIMGKRPTPVVICSTLTTKGAPTTLEALQAGAFEIVEKPTTGLKDHLQSSGQHLVNTVKAAAGANMTALSRRASAPAAPAPVPTARHADPAGQTVHAAALLGTPVQRAMVETTERIVAIGTSTGGTQALEVLLGRLPLNCPGVVVVQHMPEQFTQAFASRLDSVCQIRVKQADDGDRVLPGQALIAPGGRHLQVRRQGAYYYAVIKDGPPVSRHRPSVNVLFTSVAQCAGRNATGIIMTGMGDDGARGLLEMHQAGAITYAQDEASCVVFGMPKEAIKLGAADHVMPLDQLHEAVLGKVPQRARA
ncbi:chemotaxis response regulator protein-glutamate methylesterase [Aquabacterium lacunae]|uniref:Protein-glutamate methylesterase/protein-glutamine glutaminase n=1 Tax=Aquabacterium lacunae TaxID=2528630 RepID=A0A4Q9H0L4_9BURK|nr:chemotaxis response regulator protein-glutamate methylesterase [Aquabacterium lacunae]TBO32823.1 chemotaxis response regulator protein-glutamate methylesterase [Aquabacterium lacunae]